MSLVPFGLLPDGRLIDAGMAERGRACNCICPECRQPLIARKGNVRVMHFSHYADADTDCRNGAETALHMAAKQLVAELRWINLPNLSVTVLRDDPEYGTFQRTASYRDVNRWRFESAQEEVALGSIRPDVVALGASGERYAIEIRVTHKVDDAKAKHIRSMQLPCIEIDLRASVGIPISFEKLKNDLQGDLSNKLWIHHPLYAEHEAELLTGFEPWREKRAAEARLAKKRADDYQRAADEKQWRRDEIQRHNHAFRQLPLSAKWTKLYSELGVTQRNWPRHLAVTVREGADAFMVTKEMWQGALFARFVFGSGTGRRVGKPLYPVPVLVAWVAQRYGVHEHERSGAKSAISLYLGYLAKCGFLAKTADSYVVIYDGLLPPSAWSRPAAVAVAPVPAKTASLDEWVASVRGETK